MPRVERDPDALAAAKDTLTEIATDAKSRPQDRLRAAEALMSIAVDYVPDDPELVVETVTVDAQGKVLSRARRPAS